MTERLKLNELWFYFLPNILPETVICFVFGFFSLWIYIMKLQDPYEIEAYEQTYDFLIGICLVAIVVFFIFGQY